LMHDKIDAVPMDFAPITMIVSVVFINIKRRGFFLMKRATSH